MRKKGKAKSGAFDPKDGRRLAKDANDQTHAYAKLFERLVVPSLCGMMTFGATLHGFGFCWDDLRALQRNADVVQGSGWEVWRHDFWGDDIASPQSHKSYRPLTTLTFRLDVVLNGGVLDAAVLHRTNVLCHGLNCFLLALFCVCGPVFKEWTLGCRFTCLLFACHSVHTEAVAGLVGRADLLAGAFFMLGVIAFERNRFWQSLVLALCATLAKESGVTLVGYFVFREWSDTHRRSMLRVVILMAFLVCILALRVALHQGASLYQWTVLENHIHVEPDKWKRVWSYMHSHGRYALLLFVPYPLAFDHGLAAIETYEHPTLLGVSMYTGLAGLVTFALGTRDWTLLNCLVLAALPFAPAANVFFPVGTVLAERLLYIPSFGFCLLVGVVVDRIVDRFRSKRVYYSMLLFLFAVIAVFTAHTAVSSLAWQNEVALYEAGVQMEPRSLKALNNLGYTLMHRGRQGDLERARELLSRTIEIFPTYFTALHNLGIVHRLLGESDEAILTFRKALNIQKSCVVQALLGDELVQRYGSNGKTIKENFAHLEEAEILLRNATAECPIPYATFNLGAIEFYRNDTSETALQYFLAALEGNTQPGIHSTEKASEGFVWNAIGVLRSKRGDHVQAAEAFEKAVEANENADFLNNAVAMGWLALFDLYGEKAGFTLTSGEHQSALDRAEVLLKRALALKPSHVYARFNMGLVEEKRGNVARAKSIYRGILDENPGFSSAQEALARLGE